MTSNAANTFVISLFISICKDTNLCRKYGKKCKILCKFVLLNPTEKLEMHNFTRLLTILLVSFSAASCYPWESELEEIYEAAQDGDRLCQFAIINEHHSFDDIVPEETMQEYLQVFINEGNSRAISLATIMELKKYDSSRMGDYNKYSQRVHLKWYDVGIRHNDHESYMELGDHYMHRYDQTGHLQDSLKADELYQKAIEAGNMYLRMQRDIKKGLKAVITGGIDYGRYSYENIFDDKGPISRLVSSCAYTFAYISNAATKLIFTKEWWKVLLTLFGMLLLLIIPIAAIKGLLSIGLHPGKEGEGVPIWGMIFGFWNSICFFTAVAKQNLVWLNNTTSLVFHPSAYGLQQYLSIAVNWIALIYLIAVILITLRNNLGRESLVMTVRRIITHCIIFIVSYLIAKIGGFLILVAILSLAGAFFTAGAVVSAPAALASNGGSDSASDSKESDRRSYGGNFCSTCCHWNRSTHSCRRDPVHEVITNEYESCDRWTS